MPTPYKFSETMPILLVMMPNAYGTFWGERKNQLHAWCFFGQI
jgi:hypothetical protein